MKNAKNETRCQIANSEIRIPNSGDSALRNPQSALKDRTKAFALNVIRMIESLPDNKTAAVIGRQLLRSATSVGANYRAACRAKSVADFVAKMGIVEEEADECLYWMELLIGSGLVSENQTAGSCQSTFHNPNSAISLADLMAEANELVAITVASIKTARSGVRNEKRRDTK